MNTQEVTSIEIKDVDLFHVDGDHTVKGVMHDLGLAYDCISDNGLILVDDITYIPEVREGVDKWLSICKDYVVSKFVPSLRGEMLIWKRQ